MGYDLAVGDEVLFSEGGENPTRFVITHIDERTGYVDGMGLNGSMFASKDPRKWTKTGRYTPVVEELLDVLSLWWE